MPRSRTRPATVLVALTMLAAACDEGPAAAPTSPSSALPGETRTETPAPSSAVPPAPTTSPIGSLTSGWVRLRMSGDLEIETELTVLLSAIGSPPPGGFALVWTGEGEDATTVGLGGSSFVGVQPTAQTLVLTIAAPTDSGVSTWVSSAGECEVDLQVAQATRFAGTFACGGIRSSAGEVVDVSGVFEATG